MKDCLMESLSIQNKQFPQDETLTYALKMIGAKGSVTMDTKKDDTGVQIKAHILASLILPAKKLVDSQVTSRLEKDEDGVLKLHRYVDFDYKTEAKRTLEVKPHGVESRFQKFEEERGFIEIPDGMTMDQLVDPLSASFLARGISDLKEGKKAKLALLTRSGVAGICLEFKETRQKEVEALNGLRSQIRLQIGADTEAQTTVKGPYFSPDFEIWLDRETGILTEVSYTFMGVFGKAQLSLESART